MSSAQKIEGIPMKNDRHETRIALLEQTTSNINETLKDIKNELKDIRQDIKNLDTKMDSGLDKLNNRMWFNFYWGIGGFAGVLGVLAHAMKWI